MYRCTHPNNIQINLITGDEEYKRDQDSLRYWDNNCGKEGKWFEKK